MGQSLPHAESQGHDNTEDNAIAAWCFAAANGDGGLIRRMMSNGMSVNATDYDKRSALHLAAVEGKLEVVELLLAARAEVANTDRWGHTALDEATRGGHDIVQVALCKAGARRRAPEAPADTPDTPPTRLTYLAAGEGAPPKPVGKDPRKEEPAKRNDEHPQAANLQRSGTGQSQGLMDVMAVLSDSLEDVSFELIRQCSVYGQWAIPAEELQLRSVLSKTSTSLVHLAEWRGTEVVAKTSSALVASLSGSGVAFTESPSKETTAVKGIAHEIAVLSTLRHPDLVMFLGCCTDGPVPYLVTEFMQEGDLERHYRLQQGRLGHPFRPPAATVLRWASSVARALCCLHGCSRPIIHCTLKPSNLLLNRNQDVKVTDFGISKFAASRRADIGFECDFYTAPEVIRGVLPSEHIDIYSFALVTWFMSTGCTPFADQFGEDTGPLFKEFCEGRDPRPQLNVVGLNRGRHVIALRQLLQECWDAEPSRRPSADQCTQGLRAIVAQEASSSASLFKSILPEAVRKVL